MRSRAWGEVREERDSSFVKPALGKVGEGKCVAVQVGLQLLQELDLSGAGKEGTCSPG